MTNREKIAKAAAKEAAISTYKAIMKAPTRKVATIAGPQELAPSSKEVAKIAATAVYQAVNKLGQREAPPMDYSGTNPSFEYQQEKSYARIRNLGAPTISHVVEQAAHGQGASYDMDAVAAEWAAIKDNPQLLPEDKAAIQKLLPQLV